MSTDLKWLQNADHWGEWIRFDERPEDLDPFEVAHGRTGNGTGDRESVWLMKSTSGPKARFYAVGKGQIGPDHAAVYQATLWAFGNGYLPAGAYEDTARMFLALACRAEVRAGGCADDLNAAAS